MIIKRVKTLFFICCILLSAIALEGCNNREESFLLGYDVSNYVNLADYQNIIIDKDFVEVTNSDIHMVIEADLDSREIYKEVAGKTIVENNDIILCDIKSEEAYNSRNTYLFVCAESEEWMEELIGVHIGQEITVSICETEKTVLIKGIYEYAQAEDSDLVLDMYSCESMEEVNHMLKERIRKTIIVNYMLDKIFEESTLIKIPKGAINFVEKKDEIIKKYSSKEEFEKEFGMSIEEYRDCNYSIYYEYMIYVAIAEKEGLDFNEEDFEKTLKKLVAAENIEKVEAAEIYDKEYIVFETIADEVEEILLNYAVIK